jgi:hypothetical protein
MSKRVIFVAPCVLKCLNKGELLHLCYPLAQNMLRWQMVDCQQICACALFHVQWASLLFISQSSTSLRPFLVQCRPGND